MSAAYMARAGYDLGAPERVGVEHRFDLRGTGFDTDSDVFHRAVFVTCPPEARPYGRKEPARSHRDTGPARLLPYGLQGIDVLLEVIRQTDVVSDAVLFPPTGSPVEADTDAVFVI